ncbi:PKD-like family lipoprotein [Sphingobacterium bovistauri]|uniref:PKD-like family protein n=1 Tax=Sphingobacterium bovistauri TaxID=2781959 RepID=A0ABS7Z9Y4_9SPHI|nr:PKD-like family lipoprotein [Sphingobacterium bovistauri]MCA5005695.1 hypothetical protein [Sphingobacterium bovistauri]
MKNIFYIYIILILTISCARDKGNYDYQEVNKLTILDSEGNNFSNKSYGLTYGEQLNIEPKITGSLPTFNESQLTFDWIVAGDTISHERKLSVNSQEIGTGSKYGKLVITDLSTQGKYSANFTVNVSASITQGTFLLVEDESQQSHLVMKSINEGSPYLSFSEFNGYKLGKEPIGLEIGYKSLSLTSKSYLSVLTATKQGENPIMITSLETLYPTLLYTKNTAMISGQTLEPTYVNIPSSKTQVNNMSGYVVVNGKVHQLAKGLISDDVYAEDPLDYNVGKSAVIPSTVLEGYFASVYDFKNNKIRLFGNGTNNRRLNFFDREYAELIPANATDGHSYLASAEFFVSDWTFQYLTRKGNDLYSHNLNMFLVSPYAPKSFITSGPKNIPNLDKATCFVYHNGMKFWYFAIGRTIYRFSNLGLDVQPYLTLPEDGTGDIVNWNFDINAASNFKKIGIATYDPAAGGALKGSYYLFDIATESFETQDKYVTHKVVGLRVAL